MDLRNISNDVATDLACFEAGLEEDRADLGS